MAREKTISSWEVLSIIEQLIKEFNEGKLKHAEDMLPRVKGILSTKVLQFTADEFFHIKGRGLVACVTLPRRYYGFELYTGCTVFVNEEEFSVVGIETMGIDPFRQNARVGLLLGKPIKGD